MKITQTVSLPEPRVDLIDRTDFKAFIIKYYLSKDNSYVGSGYINFKDGHFHTPHFMPRTDIMCLSYEDIGNVFVYPDGHYHGIQLLSKYDPKDVVFEDEDLEKIKKDVETAVSDNRSFVEYNKQWENCRERIILSLVDKTPEEAIEILEREGF